MSRAKQGTKSRLHVEVTQRDIDWGIRDDSARCVVARAVARSIPDASRIEVDTQTVRFTSGGKRYAFLTPLVVQQYVADFDAGKPIGPFAFGLRQPIVLRRRLLDEANRAKYRAQRTQREAAQADSQPSTPAAPARPAAPKFSEAVHATTSEGHTPPPRVFKTKRREYGARQLRINQPQETSQAEGDRFEAEVRTMIRILDDLHLPNQTRRDVAARALRRHNVK